MSQSWGGINFENKIVLSIAVRIAAEQFMVDRIMTLDSSPARIKSNTQATGQV